MKCDIQKRKPSDLIEWFYKQRILLLSRGLKIQIYSLLISDVQNINTRKENLILGIKMLFFKFKMFTEIYFSY